jgi:hypothetical protein
VVAVQYRPFWARFIDPRVTGGIIAVALFLGVWACVNVFALIKIFGQDNPRQLALHLVAAVVFGLLAVGLLRLNRWARLLAIGVTVFMLVQGIIMLLYINLLDGLFTAIPYGLAAIYLLSPKCRRVFNKEK